MKKLYLLSIILITFFVSEVAGQGNFVLTKGKSDKVNFQLINNLIIFPVEVNGVELSFLLDTGVSKPIIFNFVNLTEELQINETERIYLRGLGEGESVEALRSKKNVFKIGDAINVNQDLYAIFDPNLNFSPRLGVPVHGIIGYDFLKDFIVEISYSSKYFKFHEPNNHKNKKCNKCEVFDLDFHNNKPYLKGTVIHNEKEIPVKLLIDTGGSDALWLFQDSTRNIMPPKIFFDDFLGHGLNGSIYGKRSRIESFNLGRLKLKNVNVAFPDSTSIGKARKIKDRNGSISGEVLKRFNLVLDAQNNKITLKKNKYFSDLFQYNKSGIALEHNGYRIEKIPLNKKVEVYGSAVSETSSNISINLANQYKLSLVPAFVVVELRKDSPAEKAGLKIGDIITWINGKNTHQYSLQDAIQLFFGEDGKRIKMRVDREGEILNFSFRLESLLK